MLKACIMRHVKNGRHNVMSNQISIDLYWKTDKNGNKYLFADPNIPATIDLNKCVFLIWPHDEDSEDFPVLAIKKKELRDPKDSREDRSDGKRRGKLWSNY